MRNLSWRALIASAFLAVSPGTNAENIAVIGTGSVGSALGPEFGALGHTIVYGSRNPDSTAAAALVERTSGAARVTTQADAAATADIVILAVPGLVVDDVVRSLGDLSGKIVIDPTNPLTPAEDGLLTLDVETSNTEIIQALAPEAHVVKAFSTINWTTMVDPTNAGGPVSVPLAGNDSNAKLKVAALVASLGLEPIDVGPAHHARYIEGMLILWINNRLKATGPEFEFYLRPQTGD